MVSFLAWGNMAGTHQDLGDILWCLTVAQLGNSRGGEMLAGGGGGKEFKNIKFFFQKRFSRKKTTYKNVNLFNVPPVATPLVPNTNKTIYSSLWTLQRNFFTQENVQYYCGVNKLK